MAKCWLTGGLVLSDNVQIDNSIEFYKRLEELDPTRRGQYQYYLKLADENVLELESS